MNNTSDNNQSDWLEAELADTIDEDYELELSEPALSDAIRKIYRNAHPGIDSAARLFSCAAVAAGRADQASGLGGLQQGEGRAVIFEGRDPAGKGGVIKRITPAPQSARRSCRRVARPFRPREDAMVLPALRPPFASRRRNRSPDRSWYNRSGVERVMGFATEDQVDQFFNDVPEFERMLVRSGIRLVKYRFSITDEEQQMRFLVRIHDPLKQWKLSPMDLQSRVRWEAYTKAKEETFAQTVPEAPWHIVRMQRQEAGAAELH